MKGFWSYARADDTDHRIFRLKRAFETTLKQTIGRPVDIYMDKSHIYWGGEWESSIDQGIDSSDFFIAVLTPSYFERHHCRRELTKALQRGLKIYPLYYRKSRVFEDKQENKTDAEVQALLTSLGKVQYRDFRVLRNKPLDSEEVRNFLDALAEEIAEG